MRKIHDISRPVKKGIPVWPGDTEYDFRFVATKKGGAAVNVGAITMSVHTGAHCDAPLHFDDKGADAASVPLSKYIGPCVVAATKPGTGGVKPADLPAGLETRLAKAPRLLLKTYSKRPTTFDTEMRHLTPELADWAADRGVVLIGVDSDSMDAFDSKDLPSHRRLAARGVAILEGIDLSKVSPGTYELVALPLRLEGADASPVRAILLTHEDKR